MGIKIKCPLYVHYVYMGASGGPPFWDMIHKQKRGGGEGGGSIDFAKYVLFVFFVFAFCFLVYMASIRFIK